MTPRPLRLRSGWQPPQWLGTTDSDPLAARLTRCSAYAYLLSMPWAAVFLASMSPHDVARIFQTGVMCLAAWAWAARPTPWQGLGAPARLAGVVLLGLGAASIVFAAQPAYAGLEFTAFALLAAVAAVFARTPMPALLRELPPILALAALLSLVMELPRMVFIYADGRVPMGAELGFMYMNYRFLNHVASILLPLTFMPLLLPAPRWVRVAAWAGLAGGLALLWRTGGRGTLIAFTLFAVGLPWMLVGQARQVVRTLVAAVAGGAAIYAVLFVALPLCLGLAQSDAGSAGQRLVGVNDAARIYLWKRALDDVAQHPLLGVGPMHYAHQPNAMAAHPHDSVLQLAAEWGLPATALLLAISAFVFVSRVRVSRLAPASDGRTVVSVSLLATLVGCVDSLVSGTLVMPVSQTWWVIAAGIMWARPADASSDVAPARAATRWLVATVVVVHLSLATCTYLWATKPWSAEPQAMFPRYWGNGQF